MQNPARLVTSIVTVGALTACTTPTATPGSPYTRTPDPAVEIVASGLRIPWGVAFLPDGRALVTERGNIVRDQRPTTEAIPRIVSVAADGKVTEIQKLPEVSTLTGEGGLLGIAVSPHYAKD